MQPILAKLDGGDRRSIGRSNLARQAPGLRRTALLHLQELTATGTPAMKARGRKLLAGMNGPSHRPTAVRRKRRAG